METLATPQPDEYADAIIEFLRDTHPGIVETWDAEIQQSVMDDDPADIWPDYRTAEGAQWWLMSEIRACMQQINAAPSSNHADERARMYTCEVTLMMLCGLMRRPS